MQGLVWSEIEASYVTRLIRRPSGCLAVVTTKRLQTKEQSSKDNASEVRSPAAFAQRTAAAAVVPGGASERNGWRDWSRWAPPAAR